MNARDETDDRKLANVIHLAEPGKEPERIVVQPDALVEISRTGRRRCRATTRAPRVSEAAPYRSSTNGDFVLGTLGDRDLEEGEVTDLAALRRTVARHLTPIIRRGPAFHETERERSVEFRVSDSFSSAGSRETP